jgi:hypothetical protein
MFKLLQQLLSMVMKRKMIVLSIVVVVIACCGFRMWKSVSPVKPVTDEKPEPIPEAAPADTQPNIFPLKEKEVVVSEDHKDSDLSQAPMPLPTPNDDEFLMASEL